MSSPASLVSPQHGLSWGRSGCFLCFPSDLVESVLFGAFARHGITSVMCSNVKAVGGVVASPVSYCGQSDVCVQRKNSKNSS